MIRVLSGGVGVSLLVVSSELAGVTIYFEDHFNGSELDPAWEVMGTGSYNLVGGELEFMTQQGDYHVSFERTYGPPPARLFDWPEPRADRMDGDRPRPLQHAESGLRAGGRNRL